MRGERILLLVACACATLGCDGGGRADAARGALQLSLDESQASREAIDAHVATAVQQVLSRSITERALQRLGLDRDPTFAPSGGEAVARVQRSARAERRGGSLVVELGVADDDPRRATEVCNALLEAVIEARLEARFAPLERRIEWLTTRRDGLSGVPADDPRVRALDAQILELELERGAVRSDATVLDACAPLR